MAHSLAGGACHMALLSLLSSLEIAKISGNSELLALARSARFRLANEHRLEKVQGAEWRGVGGDWKLSPRSPISFASPVHLRARCRRIERVEFQLELQIKLRWHCFAIFLFALANSGRAVLCIVSLVHICQRRAGFQIVQRLQTRRRNRPAEWKCDETFSQQMARKSRHYTQGNGRLCANEL